MSDVYEGIEWDVSKWWIIVNQKKLCMEMGSVWKYIHLLIVDGGEMGTVSLWQNFLENKSVINM